jgi:Diacylglycerol kinase catalytic domain
VVQRCLDTVDGSDVPVAIIPAGTANLLAHNLGIPEKLDEALRIALTGPAGLSTSEGSTASTSRSWPESASTQN